MLSTVPRTPRHAPSRRQPPVRPSSGQTHRNDLQPNKATVSSVIDTALAPYRIHPLLQSYALPAFAALGELADIAAKRGQSEPILVANSQLIYGRSQVIACYMAGVEPVIDRHTMSQAHAASLIRQLKRGEPRIDARRAVQMYRPLPVGEALARVNRITQLAYAILSRCPDTNTFNLTSWSGDTILEADVDIVEMAYRTGVIRNEVIISDQGELL